MATGHTTIAIPKSNLTKYPIPSHPIPSHPIPSHPIPSINQSINHSTAARSKFGFALIIDIKTLCDFHSGQLSARHRGCCERMQSLTSDTMTQSEIKLSQFSTILCQRLNPMIRDLSTTLKIQSYQLQQNGGSGYV